MIRMNENNTIAAHTASVIFPCREYTSVMNQSWLITLVYSLQGKITLAVCAAIVLFSFMRIMKLSAPIEYKGV